MGREIKESRDNTVGTNTRPGTNTGAGTNTRTADKNIGRITTTAVGIALVCIATRIFQFPIPLGYAHLGNCFILLFSVYFDPLTGALSAGLGSALADLLSFPQWAIPTLVIKSFMGWATAYIAHGKEGRGSIREKRTALGAAVGIVIMIAGYTIGGAILYGSVATGLTQIPGLTMEGIVGIVLFYIAGAAFEKSGVLRHVTVHGTAV